MYVGLLRRDRTLEMAHEHRDLVDALATGDSQQAATIAAEQIRASQKMVLAALLHEPIQDYPDEIAALPLPLVPANGGLP